MSRVSKGSLEAEVANAVVKFHREQQGRGPEDVRVHLAGDCVLVRSTGIFTSVEARLCGTEEGRRLIRSARHELWSIHHTEIEAVVGRILDTQVVRSYCDMDPRAAEQVEVYVLREDVERRLLRSQP